MRLRTYAWMVRRFGLRRVWRYERFRIRREKQLGRKFDPQVDGEPLLRALGYGDEEVARAKEAGLA